jgi:hypothetical protein
MLAGALLLAASTGDRRTIEPESDGRPRIEKRRDVSEARPRSRTDRREKREGETASVEGFETVFGISDEAVRRIITETYPQGWADASRVGSVRADDSPGFVVMMLRKEQGPAAITISPDVEEFGVDAVIGRGLINANASRPSESENSELSRLLEIALGTTAKTEEEWEALVSARLSESNPDATDEEEIRREVSAARAALASYDPDFLPWEAANDRMELLAAEYRRMGRERIDSALKAISSGSLRVILQHRLDERPSELEEAAEGLLKRLGSTGADSLPSDVAEEMRRADAEMRTDFAKDCAGLSRNGGSAVTAYRLLLEKISSYQSRELDEEPGLLRSTSDAVIGAVQELSAALAKLPEEEKRGVERACADSISEWEALLEMSARVRGGLDRVTEACETASRKRYE